MFIVSISFQGFYSVLVEIMAILAYIYSISQGFIGKSFHAKNKIEREVLPMRRI
jgi:hypothetical protein